MRRPLHIGTLPALVPALLLVVACGGEAGSEAGDPVRVDVQKLRQVITGFGASSAWTAPSMSDDLADQLFSAENGIGLSLLRIQITPDGTTAEHETAEKALARGAAVWAAPWSPDPAWKAPPEPGGFSPDAFARSNGLYGGRLLEEHYADWADRLVDFVEAEAEAGVPLLGLSAQNEPDYEAPWASCRFSPSELSTFVRDHLAPALAARDLDTRIIAPEASGWTSVQSYASPLLDEPAVGVIATHGYNGAAFSYGEPGDFDKELWQTEFSDDGGQDTGILSALRVAVEVHSDLGVAGVSAWHYWWLLPRTDSAANASSNGALCEARLGGDEPEFSLTRRAYALGNFSRFVRPGWSLIGASEINPSPGVFLSAFRSPDGGDVALVVTNATTRSVRQQVTIEHAELGSLEPFITSESEALGPADPIEGGSELLLELEPRSITTYVGLILQGGSE